MGNKKKWLGKVQKDIGGYKIRQMGGTRIERTSGGGEKSYFTPNGKYGVYAGRKKLIKGDFEYLDKAIEFAQTL